jgi:hypothetical protein
MDRTKLRLVEKVPEPLRAAEPARHIRIPDPPKVSVTDVVRQRPRETDNRIDVSKPMAIPQKERRLAH